MVLLIHTGGESGVPMPIPGTSRREASAHRLCSLTHHIYPKVRVSIAEPAPWVPPDPTPHSPESAKASADLMLGSMGIPGAWDSGGAQA